MNAREALHATRRGWIMILIAVIAGMLLAGIITVLSPVKYTATAEAFISPLPRSKDTDAYAASQFVLQRMPSYAQLASSSEVLQPVIAELSLGDTVEELGARVRAINPVNTVILRVSADDPNSRQAAVIANTVMDHLAKLIQDLEFGAAGQTSAVRVAEVTLATPPATPASPRLFINIVVGLAVGLLVGFWTVLARAASRMSIPPRGVSAVFRGSASISPENGRRGLGSANSTSSTSTTVYRP